MQSAEPLEPVKVGNLLVKALGDNKTRIIAIDPGQTTGICLFEGSQLVHSTQLATGLMPTAVIPVRDYLQGFDLLNTDKPPRPAVDGIDAVVIEDYRIYSWKTDEHAWQSVHTLRLLGAIEWVCHELGLPLIKQSAQQAKGFCDDLKLEAWGVYKVGQRHARDAIRHACYYQLFRVAQIQGAGKKAPFEK